MAGRPLRRVIATALERRTREELEDGATHLDYVCAWIESGKTLVELTTEISEEMSQRIPRMSVTNYLRAVWGDEAETRVAQARTRSAHALVEDAAAIIDGADDSSREKLQHAKMKADVRTWLAERYNREEYGQPKGPTVQVNIGSLHLDALRVRASERLEGLAARAGAISDVSERHALSASSAGAAIVGAIAEHADSVTIEDIIT